VALGLPLVIHWLTRPRPRRMTLSTLRFLEQAVKQRRSRHRLRDALILGSRVLAVLLLALAFARPLMSAGSITAASVERVVILDASASMGAVSKGVPAMERARELAAGYLETSNGLKVNLARRSGHRRFGRSLQHAAIWQQQLLSPSNAASLWQRRS